MGKSEPVIIARYSFIVPSFFLIVSSGFAALGIRAIVEDGLVSVMPVLIIGLFGGGALFFLVQVLVFRGRAIQIKDGKVVYHLCVRARNCTDIVDVWVRVLDIGSAAISIPAKFIMWKTRDGKKFTMQAGLLSEKAAVVVARMCAACGLPEDPNAGAPRQS
jgi:hypothetical protein